MTIEYSDATADTDAQGMRDALELSVCDGDGHLLVGCTCETVVLNGVEFVKSVALNGFPSRMENGLRRGVPLTDIIRIILYGA
mgnify:CR=1 FL=1